MVNIFTQINSNKRKSIFLMFFFIVFIIIIGWIFGFLVIGSGSLGIIIATIFAILLTFIMYFNSSNIVLAISQAKPVSKKNNPQLYNIVENMAIASGIPMPKIYYIKDSAPNAFATGRNPQKSVVCVTTGLLQKLNKSELEGVIGHELSHIKNYDIRLMTVATIFVAIIALLSDMMLRSFIWGGVRKNDNNKSGMLMIILIVTAILLALLTPLIAQLIKLSISRKREYLADASSALLTKNPWALASALEKISKDKEPLEAANKATAHLYIANPLKNYKGFINRMFSTHPPIEERIKLLKQM